MPKEEFRVTPIYIAPIAASLLVSIACAFIISKSEVQLASVTVLPERGFGPLFNAAIFVLAAGFGATMIYFLLRYGAHSFVRLLMGVAFSVLSFFLVTLYSELALWVMNVSVSFVAIVLLASFATVFVVVEVFLRDSMLSDTIVVLIGGATGTLLGASVPTFSAVSILLLLAVYDVVAVFKGPVGKIAVNGLEHLPGASFAFKEIHIGLGDLTFYSMLVSHMFLNFGWEVCAAAALGVLQGSFLSFKMVEKKGVFPGLPFSVLFGLVAGLMVLILA